MVEVLAPGQVIPALTLWQPWASLVAIGAKLTETRDWAPPPKLLGKRLAIHASMQAPSGKMHIPPPTIHKMANALRLPYERWAHELPRGAVLCTVEIEARYQVERVSTRSSPHSNMPPRHHVTTRAGDEVVIGANDMAFGNFERGRWIWVLRDVQAFPDPFPAMGKQRLWNWTAP
jgi:hypothetical protein